MNYFIDFEATQFSEEIISVGCIREDRETFYSLVAPAEGKITPFITNLTGITKEMLDTAMNPDAVFEMFYDWAFLNEDSPDFFVWGDSDVTFLRQTFKRTTSRKARMAIGYICGSITNYTKKFCKIAKIENCSLIKAFNTLVNKDIPQTHNALDDAVMLFAIYDAVSKLSAAELKDRMAFLAVHKEKEKKEKAEEKTKWTDMGLKKGTICIVNKKGEPLQIFASLNEATDWILINKISDAQRDATNKNKVLRKIQNAYNGGHQYFGFLWRIVS